MGARIRGNEERGNATKKEVGNKKKLPALRFRCERCAAAVKKN